MTSILAGLQLSFCDSRQPDSDSINLPEHTHRNSVDTISYWKVFNGGKLIKEGTLLDKAHILLKKGKILGKDTLVVSYFDDTPRHSCSPTLTIKTIEGKQTRTIQSNSDARYTFEIKTTDLQMLCFRNSSQVLRFYFNEHNNTETVYLFDIEIR